MRKRGQIRHWRVIKQVRKKFKKEREGMPLTKAGLKLLNELRSTVPHHGARMEYFDRTILKKLQVKGKDGKTRFGSKIFKAIEKRYWAGKEIILTKELQPAPLNLAIELSFGAMPESKAMRGIGKKLRQAKIRRVIKELHKNGRISFEGKTKVVFTRQSLDKIKKVFGRQDAAKFVGHFKKNLRNEIGWVRYYIRSSIDPAAVWGKW